jgi:hypothetical protein
MVKRTPRSANSGIPIAVERWPMLPEDFDKLIYQAEMTLFYDYVDQMEEFLDTESRRHCESLTAIQKKIESGEIIPPRDPGQMPREMEYDYYRLGALEQFGDILRISFFVSLYSFLESELLRRCKSEIGSLPKIPKGQPPKSYVERAIIGIGCTVDKTSNEWKEINESYRYLRNCLVHNAGVLSECARQKDLEEYIADTASISLSQNTIVLSREFCVDAFATIEKFLLSVLFAETEAG